MESIYVAPFVGAWIEMSVIRPDYLPESVAPFVGAWIEILYRSSPHGRYTVAPFVGAWIEIRETFMKGVYMESLRSSERGLK